MIHLFFWYSDPFSTPARRRRIIADVAKQVLKQYCITACKNVYIFRKQTKAAIIIQCFWKLNQHNAPIDYRHASKGILPNQEVQIYTWLNASLLEINEILKDVIAPMQGANVSVVFNIVYVDNSNGHFAMRRV